MFCWERRMPIAWAVARWRITLKVSSRFQVRMVSCISQLVLRKRRSMPELKLRRVPFHQRRPPQEQREEVPISSTAQHQARCSRARESSKVMTNRQEMPRTGTQNQKASYWRKKEESLNQQDKIVVDKISEPVIWPSWIADMKEQKDIQQTC